MRKNLTSRDRILFLTRACVIAALYVILTLISGLLGLDGKGFIQVRISEALCILPIFTTAAVPGVTVGCFLYNLIFCSPIDAVFGTLATLIGVLCVQLIPVFKKHVFLTGIPTVISNTLIIPFIVAFVYSDGGLAAVPLLMLSVFLGEVISCSVLGAILYAALKKNEKLFFGK